MAGYQVFDCTLSIIGSIILGLLYKSVDMLAEWFMIAGLVDKRSLKKMPSMQIFILAMR
jgi:hypothetical protein